jgi:4'-phosphopantetheinyl transferase
MREPDRSSRAVEPVIEVRRFALDVAPGTLADLHGLLSAEERTRAARLRFARDANRFVAGRGMMRRVLGRLLDCDPAGLTVAAGPAGKPYLPDHARLRFNAAGSEGVALLATALDIELGVDVELSAPGRDALDIARRFFTAAEHAALAALGPEQRPAAFLRCWTRKEAYVKAIGEGLHAPLDGFEVSLEAANPVALREPAGGASLSRWRLVDCSELVGGVPAALCHEHRGRVRVRAADAGA